VPHQLGFGCYGGSLTTGAAAVAGTLVQHGMWSGVPGPKSAALLH